MKAPSQLFLADPTWLQKPAAVPPAASSTQQPRRDGSIFYVPRLRETGTGNGHVRHAPATCSIRFPGSTLPEVSALVDTGASLSTIDQGLLQRLGGVVQGERLRVNGIGAQHTLGFATLSFSIETIDRQQRPVRLVFEHDFHILPAFAPGVCLGQDWITGHRVSVDMAEGRGSIVHHFPVRKSVFDFPVHGIVPHARTVNGKICAKHETTLPPACHSWVDVDTAALLDNAEYTLHPTFLTDPHHNLGATALPCILDRAQHRLLVTNFSDEPFTLPSRTVLGQAVAFGPGCQTSQMHVAFPLSHGLPTPPSPSPAEPFDPFEFDEQPEATAASEDATILVDNTWKVGKGDGGNPHPEIVRLLREHKQAFSLDGRPGHVQGPELKIPTPDQSKLRAEAPRRVSPTKRAAIDAQIAQLLEWDVVEASSSPISAPVHLVRQRDKFRFCVDYRSLNAATTPDRYPLPRIDDVLESLRGASWFSSLDAIRGYHQTDIAPEDRWKTAFITHRGLLQYKRVPFGLRNAPAFFQRFMDALLGPMRWVTALVYLDDVVIYTRSLAEHLHALRQLFTAAEASGLRFSPSKCVFAVRQLQLLGRKVSGFGLGVMEDRTTAVRELARPRTLRDLYHVLGLLSYYRQFIPRFALVAAPLYALLKGWSYRKVGSTTKLTRDDGSTTSPDAVVLDWTDELQRCFDALKSSLIQPPVLAHPDYDRPFLLYTDACKSGFAAAIHQIHVLPATSEATLATAWRAPHHLPDVDEWRRLQRADPTFGPTIRRLENGNEGEATLVLRDGVLVRRDDGRVCIPRAALLSVLRAVHDDGGHFGYAKTYAAVSSDFWHPHLSKLVEAYVRYCGVCLQTKRSRRVGALDIDHDAVRPFQHVSIDVMLGLPRTRARHDAVIIAVDTFSKMVLLQPCASTFTAKDISDFVLHRIIRMGWRPERLSSDHDQRIIGEVGQELAKFLGAAVTATPPYHHRANPVERHVQTVNRVLRSMCADGVGFWDEEVLPAVELCMNSTPSLATGITPFDAIFIDSPRLLDRLLSGEGHTGVGEWSERFQRAKHRLSEARHWMRTERLRQQRQFDDRTAPLPTVSVGQLVWIRLRDRPIRAAPEGKLLPIKIGPYPIRRVLSAHRVLVDVPAHLNVSGEFDLSQLDLHPDGEDPFAAERAPVAPQPVAPQPVAPHTAAPQRTTSATESVLRRGDRPRPPGPIHRDPLAVTYVARPELRSSLCDRSTEAFTRPLLRSKLTSIDGVAVRLVERPVAFLSRATTTAEAKLAGPELELACLAWAFTRAQHMLEGAKVTVITDHAPIPSMLSSRAGAVPYGQPIERMRAILRPHLDNITFIHKPGTQHTNVDALSRLIKTPSLDRDVEHLREGRVAKE